MTDVTPGARRAAAMLPRRMAGLLLLAVGIGVLASYRPPQPLNEPYDAYTLLTVLLDLALAGALLGGLLLWLGQRPSARQRGVGTLLRGAGAVVAAFNGLALVMLLGTVGRYGSWTEILPFGGFAAGLAICLLGIVVVHSASRRRAA